MSSRRSSIPPTVALVIGATLLRIAPETSAFVYPATAPPTNPVPLQHSVGVSSLAPPATALFAKKKKKKGGGAKKKGGGGGKKSGFEWASSFTLKPFEAQALRDLASTTVASYEGRTGRPLCDELSGAADVPKALWNAPMACVVVGTPAEEAPPDDGSMDDESDTATKAGAVVKYANAAALETVGLKPDEFERFIAPAAGGAAGGNSDGAAALVSVDLPVVMNGDKKYEGGYKKNILRASEGDGSADEDVTIIHAQRWTIEKSALIDGKFVTETTGVAYAWAEWTLGEDTLCSPGGKRGANVRPEDLEEAVAAQAAVVRELKEDQGLGNKDPEVVEAVGELLRLKGLVAAANE